MLNNNFSFVKIYINKNTIHFYFYRRKYVAIEKNKKKGENGVSYICKGEKS
jgi:hypothetical protein